MGFVHRAGNFAERCTQRGSLRPVIGKNLGIAEIDAGLHHEADDTVHGIAESAFRKGGSMQIESSQSRFRPGHGEAAENVRLAAGHGNFRADDISERATAACLFRHGAQFGGALGHG